MRGQLVLFKLLKQNALMEVLELIMLHVVNNSALKRESQNLMTIGMKFGFLELTEWFTIRKKDIKLFGMLMVT
jgi:hypothetical protein